MGDDDNEKTPFVDSRGEWGSIEDVLNEPLIGVTNDESWCSVFFMFLLMPINLIFALIAGLCQCTYACFAWSSCVSFYKSVLCENPCYLAFAKWWYQLSMGVALGKNGGVRLRLFLWEREAFDDGEYFWHGQGLWCWTHQMVDTICRSNQLRTTAFGCMTAPCPDIYPPGLLIFLPNTGYDSEWWSVRNAIHKYFTNTGMKQYRQRVAELPGLLADDWPNARLAHMDDIPRVQRTVCKCIFYCVLGVWVTDEEAEILRGWRDLAEFFVFPRIAQRLMFNYGVKQVKKLRIQSVEIIEKYELQDIFYQMNASMPPQHQRTPVVRLVDEIMYVFGFAGMGGTSACTETVGQFIQLKMPKESLKEDTDFSNYGSVDEMIAAYKQNPDAFIKESCRLNLPVTSASAPFEADTTVEMFGKEVDIAKGFLRQYTLSIANRDPDVFTDPSLFNPNRPELDRDLTWNGSFDYRNPNPQQEEAAYPRICPGRYMSLEVCKAIMNNVLASPYAMDSDSAESD